MHGQTDIKFSLYPTVNTLLPHYKDQSNSATPRTQRQSPFIVRRELRGHNAPCLMMIMMINVEFEPLRSRWT